MSVYVDEIRFVTEQCCNCGVPFAMTEDFRRRRLNDRKSFYCPKGHGQSYTGKTEVQKLKDQLSLKQDQLNVQTGRAMILENQLDDIAKTYKRVRERIKNGVCPCCNRTFENLLNHMKSEHPDFGSHEILKSLRLAYGLTQSALATEVGVSDGYVSLYENNKPLPEYAEQLLKSWVEANAD